MFDDYNKRESMYHAALLLNKTISISKSGDKKLAELLIYHGSFETICEAKLKADMFDGLEDKVASISGIDAVVKKLNKVNFDFDMITINDERYPSYLRKVDGASPVLYTRGNLDLLNSEKSIAIVGTRHPEEVDIIEGQKITKRVVDAGYVVVSGLALGCDTVAHENTIKYGGQTIAVLGTPLDYRPKQNGPLQDEIAKNHLLVSQFPIGNKVWPTHFAHRNVNTVGLAQNGVIVIKADDKSGTQNAIRKCIEENKQLYVLSNNFGKGYKWIDDNLGLIKVPNGYDGE